MWRHVAFLVLAVLCGTTGQTTIDLDCVPGPVLDKEILLNGTLTWRPSPDSNCNITNYFVTLQRLFSQEIIYDFWIEYPSLDLSFLPSCERWIINVLAIANTTVSGNSYFQGQMPLYPGTDLSLNITGVGLVENITALSWQFVNRRYAACADSYRVTVVGEFQNAPFDRYTENTSMLVPGIAACGEYSFSVRAIHVSYIYEEGPLASVIHDAPARVQGPPEMVGVFQGTTFVNTTWRIENYFFTNRCTVYAFHVDGYPLFNVTIPIEDTEARPLYQINFSNLQPSTVYTFQVSVENSAGWSEPRLILLQTAPVSGEMVPSTNKEIEITLITK